MTSQRRGLGVNIEAALVECHVFARSMQQTCDRLMLDQLRRRLTGIEPAMGLNAQHYTGIWWVGLHPLYEVHRRQIVNSCWPAPAMVVEGIHVEDIYELVSLVLPLIISCTFRILAHEEDQYIDLLSIAPKQTKAGPRNSGTPFLVMI